MNKNIIGAMLIAAGLTSVEARGEEVVRSLRVNAMGGNFDEGWYDEDLGGISAEFEVGLKRDSFTNSLGIGVNYYDWDDTDTEVTTVEIYYSPRYTFDNNWYLSGRVGYSVGDDSSRYGSLREEIDMTGLVLGFETGYTFQNNISVHLGYKAVETEVTVKGDYISYEEDGFTHLAYLGIGYTF